MSTLRVRIHKALADQKNPPQIFASIRSIEKVKTKPTVLQELVPISDQPETFKSIDVPPGHYYVETALPSGETLSDEVFVESGQTMDVVLKPDEESPHEWLSWQQIAGNVQPKVKRPRRTAMRGGGNWLNKGLGGRAPNPWLRYLHTDPDDLPPTAIELPPEVNVREPLEWLRQPDERLVNRDGVWQWLPTLSTGSPAELIQKLSGGRATMKVSPASSDSDHGIFRVSLKPTDGTDVVILKGQVAESHRTYLVVRRRTGVELLLLPMPWYVLKDQREVDIEVVIQEPADPTGFSSSAIARAEDIGLLLKSLTSNSLATLRMFAETAQDWLYDKNVNPFAAAAGAYALVGTAMEAKDKEWHQWVFNLMMRFPFIPDGPIQWAQLKMRMRRSAEEIADAKKAFKEGYHRGLPFYSIGVRWLLEGLEWFAGDDPEAKEMADHVRHIAYRTNYQQPFTTVRVGGDGDV